MRVPYHTWDHHLHQRFIKINHHVRQVPPSLLVLRTVKDACGIIICTRTSSKKKRHCLCLTSSFLACIACRPWPRAIIGIRNSRKLTFYICQNCTLPWTHVVRNHLHEKGTKHNQNMFVFRHKENHTWNCFLKTFTFVKLILHNKNSVHLFLLCAPTREQMVLSFAPEIHPNNE